MPVNGGLHDHARYLRVDAGGQEKGGGVADLREQLFGVLIHGDGVQIDDAVDAFVLVLHTHPILERAEIIADVEIAGWLDARKDSWFHAKRGEVLS